MSLAKRMIEEKERYYNIAKKILLKMGEISLCKYHSDESFFYRTYCMDEDQIYSRATIILKQQYPEYLDFKEFHDQVNKVLENSAISPNDCPSCIEIEKG